MCDCRSRPWTQFLAALSGCAALLAACAPTQIPTSTQPPASAVVPTPQQAWTLPPAPSALPLPTVLPPWPTAQSTPTAAAPLYPDMQTATFFFYWHACPEQNCRPDIIYALPPGWTEPLAGDPDARDGLYYSSYNRYWYLQELLDMRLAGIDVVLPVSWGDNPLPWFRTAVLEELVAANRLLDPPLRIGLFDDTTSEVSEYNDYADNREFDGSAYIYPGLPLDLSDPAAGFFFYDRKIRPFFQTIPQDMWATHNGRPVEEGGRPLIVVYLRTGISRLDRAGTLWLAIKGSFARDFQDSAGRPITPFVILEDSWFNAESLGGNPPLDAAVDGRYAWGTALLGPRWHTWRGYTVSSVGVGFDDLKNVNSSNRLRERDIDPQGRPGGPGAFFQGGLERIPDETDLLLIETWNELYEGTNICRAAYPEIAGQPVAEDFYIDLLRRFLRGQGLWWAARPLSPSWPTHLERGRSYRLDLALENSGARTWSAAGGEHLLVTGDLFPGGYRAWPTQPVRPGEVGLFSLPLTAPDKDGSFQISWQMVGPEGPFGPPASWALPVRRGVVTTTLQVPQPKHVLLAGRPFTLTTRLDPAIQLLTVRLDVRFDPSFLALEGAQPLLEPLQRWQVEVDNERGLATIELWSATAVPADRLALLRLRAHTTGQGGLWIERADIRLHGGAFFSLPALWVPLTVDSNW